MIKLVSFMLCAFYHTQNFGTSLEGNHRGVKLIATLQMLPTHQPHLHPNNPGVQDCLLCSGLPTSVLGDVSAPALHG